MTEMKVGMEKVGPVKNQVTKPRFLTLIRAAAVSNLSKVSIRCNHNPLEVDVKKVPVLFLLLLLAGPVWGQEKMKIGFVDLEKAIQTSDQMLQRLSQL